MPTNRAIGAVKEAFKAQGLGASTASEGRPWPPPCCPSSAPRGFAVGAFLVVFGLGSTAYRAV